MRDDIVGNCAAGVRDLSYLVMRTMVKTDGVSSAVLQIDQMNVLLVIKQEEGADLSLLSDRVGDRASAVVDDLLEQGYVLRATDEDDAGEPELMLTELGDHTLDRIRFEEKLRLAERLAALTPGELTMIDIAMDVLRKAFGPGPLETAAKPLSGRCITQGAPT